MNKQSMVKEILESIASVRVRAKQALESDNNTQYVGLMMDLSALEACLVIEATSLMIELDKIA